MSAAILHRRFQVILLALGLLTPVAPAQPPADKPKPGDVMIEKYLAAQTVKLSERFLDGATTLDEWQKRRPRLKEEFLDMLGLRPLPEKTPLHVTITGTLEREGVVIEKLHFQSRPKLYVTANLFRPKEIKGKLPAVLYVCGHAKKGRDGNKTGYTDHGLWFAANGYVCLMIDTLQLGEVTGIHHGTYREGRMWWQAAGYTPAGVECWNGIRAIDYLLSRPEVDAERLAVTGISGGGAYTFWIAVADDRVKCAVPVSGMSDLECYVTNKEINRHCDCMFLINTYQWDWTTIAAMVAPRPLLFANSDSDKLFPMDGNRRIIQKLRKVYQMHGKPELVDEYVSMGGHDYRPDLRVAIFKWINKHVKNDTSEVKDADFKPIPGEELRVFPKDEDLPKDAINNKIDETFVPRAQVKLPEAGKFEEWKKGLMKELREKSIRTFPGDPPGTEVRQVIGGGLQRSDGLEFATASSGWRTNRYASSAQENANAGTMILLNAADELSDPPAWCEPYIPNWKVSRVHQLHVRGNSLEAWNTKSPPNYVERSHALLGETVDQGKVSDVVTEVKFLNTKTNKRWKVLGRGQAGILAAYAALFEPSISEVVIVDPPTSHKDGPIFLNVLRVLDIPEALGMLAPRPLTLINAKDPVFDRTAEIYKLAGAADKLTRK